jgi:enterochelin esterase family protein
VLLHKESVVAVGGNPLADLYVEPDEGVARGHVDTIFVYSPEQDVTRKVLVYVPPVEQDSFPVLYLMHGISGDEATWIECGRVPQVMDNLLAHGRVRPMIVVMPDCNVPNKLEPKKRTNMLRNIFNFPQLRMGAFEEAFVHLHKSICEQYPISSRQKDHFVAGLSSGAMQAANIARDRPELFGKVGLFSPARMKEEQFMTHKHGKDACVPCVESQPVYFVCIGKRDYFFQDGKRFIRRLANAGLTCEVYETDSGHTWRSWREYLVVFIQSL